MANRLFDHPPADADGRVKLVRRIAFVVVIILLLCTGLWVYLRKPGERIPGRQRASKLSQTMQRTQQQRQQREKGAATERKQAETTQKEIQHAGGPPQLAYQQEIQPTAPITKAAEKEREQAATIQKQIQRGGGYVRTPQPVNQQASAEKPPELILPSGMPPVLAIRTSPPESHVAMLYPSGSVVLNGVGVTRPTAIFPRDKVQVPVESAAAIATKGSSVTVAPGSCIVFQGDAVDLDCRSAVSISTTDAMTARVQRLTIGPTAKADTRFQVVRLNGDVLVSTKLGTVAISDQSFTLAAVAEGRSTTLADPDPATCQVAAGVPPPPTVPQLPAPPVSGAETAAVSLTAAGTAVGMSIVTIPKPVTPVRP